SHCLTDQPPIDGVYEIKRIDRKEQDAVSSPQILLQSSPDRMQEAIIRFALFRPFKNRWHLDAEQLQTSLPSRGREQETSEAGLPELAIRDASLELPAGTIGSAPW